MSPDQPVAWTIYFASEDIDTSAKLITEHGGAVLVSPFDVGDICRIAIAKDNVGAVFGVYQPKSSPGIEVIEEPGALVWESAQFSGVREAREFYREVFGHTVVEIPGIDLEMYAGFGLGADAQPLGGTGAVTDPDNRPFSAWTPVIAVADVDASVATARGLGAKVIAEPEDTPYGRMGTITDPWGGTVVVHGENHEPTPRREN